MDISADDFAALFAAVSTWGRWGESDERGALHHLTPAASSRPPDWSGTASPSA
jgi:hypothetical protein